MKHWNINGISWDACPAEAILLEKKKLAIEMKLAELSPDEIKQLSFMEINILTPNNAECKVVITGANKELMAKAYRLIAGL